MDQKVYHGSISPFDFAQSLVAEFNRGNFRVQQLNHQGQVVVQIATSNMHSSGGQTALTITLRPIEDGVSVELGEQQWLGVAADLGMAAVAVLVNPMNLLYKISDLAQDLESFQLKDSVWKIIDRTAHSIGASFELSEKLRRLECSYCGTANDLSASNCIACGAPLGDVHPTTCPQCGFVIKPGLTICPNCHLPIHQSQ
jgi:DNA-directed RNA polymerase subunit RPC12/RpoP